ncbi:hypothetical protein L210DRAFT_935380 [Boletus edulis BED1]|uniref:Uncharacterized protein n=1 Tax=Boletus edulis BED1 TaxID=1328754 RepID=A0AAD4BHQ7_BOLED|nr:hypothetical protein L210DRAFT_935380 [Boletus edulis BED1]
MPLLQVLFFPAPSGDWSDGNDSAVIDVDGIGNPDATNKDPKDVPMSDTIVEADPAVQLVPLSRTFSSCKLPLPSSMSKTPWPPNWGKTELIGLVYNQTATMESKMSNTTSILNAKTNSNLKTVSYDSLSDLCVRLSDAFPTTMTCSTQNELKFSGTIMHYLIREN